MPVSFVIISKDEPALDATLGALEREQASLPCASEIVVVDASAGRLDGIREAHPPVRWHDFAPSPGVATSIPQQRNLGVRLARGEIVAFTDCGCLPEPGWAAALLAPILAGEETVTVGRATGRGRANIYRHASSDGAEYLSECPTINLAFTRVAFEDVGGFDERFAYGSDIDFSWRLVRAGHRLRSVPEAVVSVDWGSPRRQLRRAWSYGRARARLYRKHRSRLRVAWRSDPVPFAYGAYVLGLPLALLSPWYLGLLAVPALRNREGPTALTLIDHLLLGAGFVRELAAPGR
ncbi:MAG TPA: glycosyltransferase family 2 protein [Solirubrobacteraceae bacterium]|nr:glycosyltransferase family 2 protein [Solirubrobacteraceae bacterium]